ncbi:MAG: LLM class flavin-dependent oxidoreductase [Bacteriovorax sp.]|nr:LLM class flavin-dependent oxidoreductase [Bacteriovorax sp.]
MMKKIKYSVLDLAPVAEGASIAEAFANSVELAQHAENMGYTRHWLAEHHTMDGIASSATSVLIGHLASKTKTIRVGSGGIMLPNHSPLIIAEQFGTLETLYPGRIDLGLGRAPGTNQETMRAIRRNLSSQNFAEQVQELLEYFSANQEGKRVKAFPGVGLKIPVWLLGSSLYSAELAGTLGLPYSFASHFAPDLMMEALHVYRNLFKPSQFLKEPYVMIGVQVVAAESDEKANFLATTVYQRFLALIRGQSLKMKPPVKNMDELWDKSEQDHLLDKLQTAAIGGPEKVKQQLLQLAEITNADELMITSDVYDQQKRLRTFEIVAEAMKEFNFPN